MSDYLLLMHALPAAAQTSDDAWGAYFAKLRALDAFNGGSSMGGGVCVTKSPKAPAVAHHLTGYIRVRAESLDAAKLLVDGNPVYEAGGVVEVRELPRD